MPQSLWSGVLLFFKLSRPSPAVSSELSDAFLAFERIAQFPPLSKALVAFERLAFFSLNALVSFERGASGSTSFERFAPFFSNTLVPFERFVRFSKMLYAFCWFSFLKDPVPFEPFSIVEQLAASSQMPFSQMRFYSLSNGAPS